MSTLALVASIVVGVTFLVAGASKIAAGAQWPVQAAGLGAPAAVVPAVPWIEIALGALLVVRIAEPFVTVAALVVLVVFTGLIARRLAAGDHPPCACFGAWSATPLGVGHLVRNAVLIALTVVALFA